MVDIGKGFTSSIAVEAVELVIGIVSGRKQKPWSELIGKEKQEGVHGCLGYAGASGNRHNGTGCMMYR
ncbi:MAG TPA: hypothetical protein G4O19_00850 [Dehalococcoidia bacterium]|nr:hypothetical protein [Dehalococcoidia bacterium]